jgi:hypothetical protein
MRLRTKGGRANARHPNLDGTQTLRAQALAMRAHFKCQGLGRDTEAITISHDDQP